MIKSLFSRKKPEKDAAAHERAAPLKSLFTSVMEARKSGKLAEDHGPEFDRTKVAAATLMVEVARLDTDYAGPELDRIRGILCRHFGVTEGECSQLLELAEHRHEEAYTNWLFTKTLKEQASVEERVSVMEYLWAVAYADGVLHELEADLLLRIGQAIGLPEASRIHALERHFAKHPLEAHV